MEYIKSKFGVKRNMKDLVKLEINKPTLSLFVEEAGKIALHRDAGEGLLRLTEARDLIDKAIEQVKKLIVENGIKAYGVVPSVKYKGLSIYQKETGDKYTTSNPNFIKKSNRTWADSQKIEEYLEKEGKLPKDTVKNSRDKVLVIQK